MHEQIIQAREVGAEPNCETREMILSSFKGRGRMPRLTVGEPNTQSFIEAVQSWLAAREVMHEEPLAHYLGT